MSVPREPKATVSFVDQYCAYYRDVFPEVRSFEYRSYWIPGSWHVRMSYTEDISGPNP
jgi:hypothetical protein